MSDQEVTQQQEDQPSKVDLVIHPDAGLDDLTAAFRKLQDAHQKMKHAKTRASMTTLPSGEVAEVNSTIVPIRFNENVYAITGFNMRYNTDEETLSTIREFQGNPLPEMVQPGSFFPLVFQSGSQEAGANGITMESLLVICADRLTQFNSSEYACVENALALDNIRSAIEALNQRMLRRMMERHAAESNAA